MSERLDLEYKWLHRNCESFNDAIEYAWHVNETVNLFAEMFGRGYQEMADMCLNELSF